MLKSKIMVEDIEYELIYNYKDAFNKEDFISKICDYLAVVRKNVFLQKEAILITGGGETSYKCLKAIGSKNLQIIDTVAPAIPLGVNHKGQLIVTKSGNLGTQNTLVEIIKYFEQDK